MKLHLLGVGMALLLLGIACNNISDSNPVHVGPGSETLAKQTGDVDGLRPMLKDVARFLARNSARIPSRLRNRLQSETLTLSRVMRASKFPTRVQDAAGRKYDIGVEFAEYSTLNEAPLRVALDPDRFYPNENTFPVFVFDPATKSVKSEELTVAVGQTLPFPLALVTLEDRTETSWEDLKRRSRIYREVGLAKTGALSKVRVRGGRLANSGSTAYLKMTEVRLYVDKDPFSKEEFEVYIREGTGFGDPVFKTTTHVFDGKQRQDAAGEYRVYPDVNRANRTYSFGVALWPLSDLTPISVCAIEDDKDKGEHDGGYAPSGVITVTFGEEYRRFNNRVFYNVDRKMEVDDDGYIDQDDVYKKGMWSEWTYSNAPPIVEQFTLSDLRVKFVRYVPTPPPPAPVVQGSVKNGYPKLTWNAVSGADHYEVKLADSYDNQTLTWNVSGTSFEDPDRFGVMLGGTCDPCLAYTVKTVLADGTKSAPSNQVVYTYLD